MFHRFCLKDEIIHLQLPIVVTAGNNCSPHRKDLLYYNNNGSAYISCLIKLYVELPMIYYEVCTLDMGSYDAVTRRLSRNVIPTPTCPPHPLPVTKWGCFRTSEAGTVARCVPSWSYSFSVPSSVIHCRFNPDER